MAEVSLEDIQAKIQVNPITVCYCYASWKKGSRELLESLQSNYGEGAAVSSVSTSAVVNLVVLSADDDEEQEVAVGLNITEIPAVYIYKKGGKLFSILVKDDLYMEKISQIVNNMRRMATEAPTDAENVLKIVSDSYAGTLKGTQGKLGLNFFVLVIRIDNSNSG